MERMPITDDRQHSSMSCSFVTQGTYIGGWGVREVSSGGSVPATCELWEKTLAIWKLEFLFLATFSSFRSNEEFGWDQLFSPCILMENNL